MDVETKAESRCVEGVATSIWRLAVRRTNPLAVLHQGNPTHTLYCIHPVSGDVVGFKEMASLLGDRQIVGIQVPRQSMNASYCCSIESIAKRYVSLIEDYQPSGTVGLIGWSAGAVIALEMAQQLRNAGREAAFLVALDGAPCNTGAGIKVWNPLYAAKLLVNLPRWIKYDRQQDWSFRGIAERVESKLAIKFGVAGSVRFSISDVDTMDAASIKRVIGEEGWSSDQKLFMHALYKSMARYSPETYGGKVVAYETTTEPLYHLRQIAAAWRKIAAHTDVVRIKGSHSGLIAQPAIGTIAADLKARLDAHDAMRLNPLCGQPNDLDSPTRFGPI